MSIRKLILLVGAVALLSSCAGGCGDPGSGGLIGGIQGVYGGCYDKRLEQKKALLQEQQQANQQLENSRSKLHAEYLSVDNRLAAEQRELTSLNQDIRALEAKVAKLQTTPSMQKMDIVHLRERIQEIKSNMKLQQDAISRLDREDESTADPEEYQVLLHEREKLRKEYVALVEYSQALANSAN